VVRDAGVKRRAGAYGAHAALRERDAESDTGVSGGARGEKRNNKE
jgi:hypothetical protein